MADPSTLAAALNYYGNARLKRREFDGGEPPTLEGLGEQWQGVSDAIQAGPDNARKWLEKEPGYTYSSIVPLKQDASGNVSGALPDMFRNPLIGALDLMQMKMARDESGMPVGLTAPGLEAMATAMVPWGGRGLDRGVLRSGGGPVVEKPGIVPALPMAEASRMARAKEMGFDVDAYHGTNQPLTKFDAGRQGASTGSRSSKEGAFFTDDPALAADYAANAGNNLVADVGRHEKAVTAARKASEAAERLAQRTGKSEDWMAHETALAKWENLEIGALRADPLEGQNIIPVKIRMENPKVFDAEGGGILSLAEKEGAHLDDLMKSARAAGHDGVVVKNLVDGTKLMGDYAPSTHYAVFDPKNIRSRFAAFDPAKADSAELLALLLGTIGVGAAAAGGQPDAGQTYD